MLISFLSFALAVGAFWLTHRNVGPAAGPYACVPVPAALLGWTLWRPADNRIELRLCDGLYVWTGLGIAYAMQILAVTLLVAEGGASHGSAKLSHGRCSRSPAGCYSLEWCAGCDGPIALPAPIALLSSGSATRNPSAIMVSTQARAT